MTNEAWFAVFDHKSKWWADAQPASNALNKKKHTLCKNSLIQPERLKAVTGALTKIMIDELIKHQLSLNYSSPSASIFYFLVSVYRWLISSDHGLMKQKILH
ncbi:hypothetical protein ATANTOWER_027045 [Ataeniobius toweri]|uniref:Uncharacterized protein n=1 Tax=Ataeniobius toweri TaxID=208326 RepID=A0ABU7A2K1_9TELE|nr:hypothetical protein [Ataeniobius toweri]